ncbi:MAG: RNA pyrophosphohydrolase [Thermoleophilia bacterium]|nr:RNA pyrophosphohydrolase [Thermoleophilia bacterium]
MPRSQHFRANVGAAIVRDDGHVLVFERSDRPGNWQLPQGGLDLGEEPLEGALRELREETGILPDQVRMVSEYPGWLAYEWPEGVRADRSDGRRGQVQKWFAFRPESSLSVDLSASEEFRDHRAVGLDELVAGVHPMRRAVYAQLVPWLRDLGA